MGDDPIIDALAEAVTDEAAETEAIIQDAITARAESSDEAAVEIARINADAAVSIAETQAQEDEEWFAAQFNAVAAQHTVILEILARLEASLQATQILLTNLVSTPTPPLPEPEPEPEPITPPESSVQNESIPAERRRIRRLL